MIGLLCELCESMGTGSEPSPFRPTPPLTSTPFSSSRPAVGSAPSTFRPAPQPPGGGPFQRFPMPQLPSTAQTPPLHAPPMGQPSIQQPQPQTPFVPMGSPPLGATPPSPGLNFPPPVLQPSFPGYARAQTGAEMQAPPVHSSLPANQRNYGPVPPAASSPFLPHQGGYVPPPSMAAPLGIQPPMQQPGSGPPVGAIKGLTEDFSSFSIQTRPGLMEPSVDAKELPRPLDGDVEPKSLAEMYPMNCNPRYLRLTTNAIPSSQSLASRWHLPLGAVVCPLAEPPDGVSGSLSCLISSNSYWSCYFPLFIDILLFSGRGECS